MSKLIKNIFFVSVGEASSRIFGFLTTIFLIRAFSVEDYGIISIATAIYGYAVLLSVHWLNPFGVKKISTEENLNFIPKLTSIRFALAFIAYTLIFVYVMFANLNNDTRDLLLYYNLSLLPSALFLDWFFQAKEDLKSIAFGKFLLSGIYLFLLFLIVSLKNNISFVGLAFFGANLICAFYFIVLLFKKYNLNISIFSFKDLKLIVKEALPLSVATVLSQVNINLPIILIGILLSTYKAGIFSAAYKLIFFMLLIDRFYYSIFFPSFTKVYKFTSDIAEAYFNNVLKITLIVLIFFTALCFIFAPNIILLIFGTEYSNSISVFRILLFYFFITIMNSIFSYGMIAIGEEKYFLRIAILGVILNITLLIPLIHYYDITGAAFSIVLVEASLLILLVFRLKKFVQLRIKKYILSLILLNLIATIVIYFIRDYNELISIVVGMLTYFIGLLVTKLIKKNELDIIKL